MNVNGSPAGPVADVALLLRCRDKAKELVKNWTAFLKANDMSAGHFNLFPEPAIDEGTIMMGLIVEELRSLDWRITSHSTSVIGQGKSNSTGATFPMMLVSFLIERANGKQLVHLG